MLLDNRESAVASYDRWNDSIFTYFFGPEKAGRDIRLTFDDAALAAVATQIDSTPDAFIAAVANLIRSTAADPFAKFRELGQRDRDVPSTIALLAAQVLVASRMHADSHYSAQAFWPRFNSLLLRRSDFNPPRGCEILGQWWRDLETFLNTRTSGALGILRIPQDPTEAPLRGWRHVNYPLSQCLVREVDRADLADFFFENPTARECPESRLIGVLSQSQYAFGKSFGATLRQAIENSAFALELARVLSEIRAQVSRHAPTGASTAGSSASERRARTRLKLLASRGEIVLVLQQLRDDWRDRMRLDAEQWENGVSDDRGYSLWSGADYTVFAENADGFVTTRESLRSGMRVRVLISAAHGDVFQEGLLRAGAGTLPLSEQLDGVTCYQFTVNEERDADLLSRFDVASGTRPSIRLEGGLEIGHSRFVSGSAPRIVVQNVAGSHVSINGVSCSFDERGAVRCDHTPRDVGDYEVAVDDVCLRYAIVDLSMHDDSHEGGYVGYMLSPSQAILKSEDLSLNGSSHASDVVVLVGAEIQ